MCFVMAGPGGSSLGPALPCLLGAGRKEGQTSLMSLAGCAAGWTAEKEWSFPTLFPALL